MVCSGMLELVSAPGGTAALPSDSPFASGMFLEVFHVHPRTGLQPMGSPTWGGVSRGAVQAPTGTRGGTSELGHVTPPRSPAWCWGPSMVEWWQVARVRSLEALGFDRRNPEVERCCVVLADDVAAVVGNMETGNCAAGKPVSVTNVNTTHSGSAGKCPSLCFRKLR